MEKLLVVEDEKELNDIVRDYLSSLGYEVTQCFTGPDAVKYTENDTFDLAILDLMLPGLDGIEVARRIRAKSELPIIMLTARDSEVDKLLGLEVGADDYMTKPFSVRELGARIRAVLRRCGNQQGNAACGEPVSHRGIELDIVKRKVTKAGQTIELTSAQFDLFRILLQTPGRVFTRGELIEKLSGYEYEGYERTIDVHIKNLRKALEDDPAEPELILTVWGVGYKVHE
jgi:two-component system, OmpR family, alkaline phosphatase synthesis response regulator PhoP